MTSNVQPPYKETGIEMAKKRFIEQDTATPKIIHDPPRFKFAKGTVLDFNGTKFKVVSVKSRGRIGLKEIY